MKDDLTADLADMYDRLDALRVDLEHLTHGATKQLAAAALNARDRGQSQLLARTRANQVREDITGALNQLTASVTTLGTSLHRLRILNTDGTRP